jgi:hypothetical protein
MSKLFKRTQVVASLLGIFEIVYAMTHKASVLIASNWGGLTAANIGVILIPFVFQALVVGGLAYWLGWVSVQPSR